ncbi:hypothetical protein AB6A40_003072 [Gnathostoma spinigerum]|uniref:G-protein coupled receptors family 1 profile domain-containing protein n=1 Tax=Gnathostoma spinigerum TaxID=75299 RepID=A0ABD6EHC8_9BILA
MSATESFGNISVTNSSLLYKAATSQFAVTPSTSTVSFMSRNTIADVTNNAHIIDSAYADLDDGCTVMSAECECHMSYQFYDYEETLLLGIITLPVIIFGLIANIISLRIFSHRVMRASSLNWYLAILSCSDTLILLSAFFVLSLPRIGEYMTAWTATSLR